MENKLHEELVMRLEKLFPWDYKQMESNFTTSTTLQNIHGPILLKTPSLHRRRLLIYNFVNYNTRSHHVRDPHVSHRSLLIPLSPTLRAKVLTNTKTTLYESLNNRSNPRYNEMLCKENDTHPKNTRSSSVCVTLKALKKTIS